MKLLVELRPALDGHAGIPQATRLLFLGLSTVDGLQVDGFLQSSNRLLSKGMPADDAVRASWAEHRKVNALARLIVSLQPGEDEHLAQRWLHGARLLAATAATLGSSMLGRRQKLGVFDASLHRDFVWRALFASTLASESRMLVTGGCLRIGRLPWSAAHAAASLTSRFGRAVYPLLDTRGYDVFIAETPFPGRVSPDTRLVVRYHDAVPLLMPHTIADRARHQQAHYHALQRNVADGAWFACVSEASRRDLVSVFPRAAERAVVIPNVVSDQFHGRERAAAGVPDILLTRSYRASELALAEQHLDTSLPDAAVVLGGAAPEYLLMVSTLEPRKNHLLLLAAWEQLRAHGHPKLRLVMVGMLGWDSRRILKRLVPWMRRGDIHLLGDVPAAELRLLYRQARATVCPSLAEGFGYSGVEAMRCGSVVVASNIPAHLEVYGDAAEYFDPYSAADLADTLRRVLHADAQPRRTELSRLGDEQSARYLPENVQPQWQTMLRRLDDRGA